MVSIGRSVVLFCFSVLLLACHTKPHFSYDTVYGDALQKFNRGDFKPALAEIDNALANVGDAQSINAWRFRLLKAEILIWQGHSRDAASLLAPESASANALPQDLAARRMVLLGVANSSLQLLDTAEEDFREAERLNRPAQPSTTCMLLLGQGKVAALHDQFTAADGMFRRALAIARAEKLPLSQASAMGNLGMLNMRQRRYGDAVDWFNASLELAKAQNEVAPTMRLIGNLGWAYLETGDLDRAEENFEQAASMAQQNGMISDEETWLSNTGAVELLQRRFLQSRRTFEHSLELARSLEDRQHTIYNLNDLAKLAVLQKQPDVGERMNREAVALEKAIGDHDAELYSDLNEALIALASDKLGTSVQYLQKILSATRTDVSLKSETLGTLAKVEARQHHVDAAIRLFDQGAALLDKTQATLGRPDLELSYPSNAEGIYDDYVHFLISNGREDEALSVIETHRARTLMTGAKPETRRLTSAARYRKAMQAAARDSRVILSYWLGSETSYVWLIHGREVHMATLPDQDQVRSMVERYRARWTSSFSSSASDSSAGQELYQTLVAPVSQWIPANATISIVPDGPLCGLNFETLVVRLPSPHYWIEDASFTVIRSIAQLGGQPTLLRPAGHAASLAQQAQATRHGMTKDSLLLVGDPKAPQSYPALLHAHEEVDTVAKHFDRTRERLITGPAATPVAYFAAKPEDYTFIHFVAHGTASRTSPLDSAVVLSDDGKSYNLYARQVMSHPIRARLVTISACDSAGDRVYSAQGLVGMSWAFLRAGAHEVVAALWEVNDTSTPHFMDEFYEMISNGRDPALALRDAKLKMLHSGTVYAKPLYWAPFVLYEAH
jgi:CHAT domain-containing protein/Tfp pilus assembly protein PilF